MKSTVMNNAFYILYKIILSNGEINIDEEIEIIKSNKKIDLDKVELDTLNLSKKMYKANLVQNNHLSFDDSKTNKIINEEENSKNKEHTDNFINNNQIISFYNKFCNKLKNSNCSNLFIIMKLPKEIKGFIFRFLKIVINSKGIKLNLYNIADTTILLKAYLIIVIISEQNHFIKRYFTKDVKSKL